MHATVCHVAVVRTVAWLEGHSIIGVATSDAIVTDLTRSIFYSG